MLRFGYDTNGFAHHRLEDAIEILRGLGYTGVGLTLDVHHLDPYRTTPAALREWKARLAGLDVTIQTGARFLLDRGRKHEPTLLSNEAEGRARRVDFLRRAVDVGAALGARAVSFWSGRAPGGAEEDSLWERLVAGCEAIGGHAASAGIAASFEPEPGMWIEDLAGYRRLRDRLATGRLGLSLDVGHLAVAGEALGPALDEHAKEIRVVQIEDIAGRRHEHRMIGEGEIDFVETLRCFLRARLTVVLELELSRDSHRAPECAARAIQILRECERRAMG